MNIILFQIVLEVVLGLVVLSVIYVNAPFLLKWFLFTYLYFAPSGLWVFITCELMGLHPMPEYCAPLGLRKKCN